MIPYTENRVIRALMSHYLEAQCIAIPNTKAVWKRLESDLIVITPYNVTYELEVKLSRSDFFKDFKKERKHRQLRSGSCPLNHFAYVCPEGMVKIDEVPEYAGLIWMRDTQPFTIKKSPALNRKFKVGEKLKNRLFRSLAWKYIN